MLTAGPADIRWVWLVDVWAWLIIARDVSHPIKGQVDSSHIERMRKVTIVDENQSVFVLCKS